MNRPEDLDLSREDGDALIERLETEIWTAEDRQVLIQVVRLYFCLLFALKETQLSLNRFRIMLFGEKAKLRKPSSEASLDAEPQGGGDGVSASGSSCDATQAPGEDHGTASEPVGETPPKEESPCEANPDDAKPRRGHGRLSAEAYTGAERVECRHQELAPGDRCPVCGIGWLSRCHPVARCASTVMPCSVPFVMRWRNCAARPAASALARRCLKKRARKNITPVRDRPWS